MPPGWPAWVLAFLAVLAGTILSAHPSGLQWAGLLQWLSLLGGILALQDVLRRQPTLIHVLLWALLCAGALDGARWLLESYEAYAGWWKVKVDGLPIFPVRIRLFGSNGSTQAASWLGGLILLVAFALLPRIRRREIRWAVQALLVTWSLLLGLCDSRLAYAGLLVGFVIGELQQRAKSRSIYVVVLPALVWWLRDLAHPSMAASGGGIGWGAEATMAVGILLLIRWSIGPGRLRMHIDPAWIMRTSIGTTLLPALVPLLVWVFPGGDGLRTMATGRIAFWNVALDAWKDHPLFGIGPWTFVHEYSRKVDWTFGFLAMHPHNAFLELLLAGGAAMALSVAILVFMPWRSAAKNLPASIQQTIAGLLASLGVGMTFDSPLSSPQVMTLMLVAGGVLLSCVPAGRSLRIPRTFVLLPTLVLVPLAFLFEAQASKIVLLRTRELLRAEKWQQAAELLIADSANAVKDPQWQRNVLIAKSMLASQDSAALGSLRDQWLRQVQVEPGFLPNRIHLHWIAWRMDPSTSARESLRLNLGKLSVSSEVLPTYGAISPGWIARYPTDDPVFWKAELAKARTEGSYLRAHWIERWLETQYPRGARITFRTTALGARGATEAQLYGSEGTGWLLVPQIVEFSSGSTGLAIQEFGK